MNGLERIRNGSRPITGPGSARVPARVPALVSALALAAALLLAAGPARVGAQPSAQPQAAPAQGYPSKTIRLVVGFAPGGGTDIVARLLASKLSQSWGQQVVVENKPGATGMLGAGFVANAPADGYTILMGHVNSNAIAPSLSRKPPYDPIRDFAAVAYVGYVPNVLVVNAKTPVHSLAELVALSKSRPQGLTFASPGAGSTNHLAGELLRSQSGAQLVHVPYEGSGPAIVDLLGGQIDMNFDAMSSVVAHLKAGTMRALAVTPAPIVQKLNEELNRIMTLPDVAQKLDELGVRRRATSAAARPPEGGAPLPRGDVRASRTEGSPVSAAARPPEGGAPSLGEMSALRGQRVVQ